MACPSDLRNPTALARERGVISVLVAFLLVAGVIFILSQTTGIVGTRSMDTSQQLDSTAALMLAESGLQRAEAMVGRSGNSGTLSEAECLAVETGGPFTLGRGSFTYSTPEAYPTGCSVGLCNTCTVGVTGTVGSAARTLKQVYNIGVSNGVAGRGTTVTMVLRNIHDVPATSLFNLAWQRQDPGGNADATFCANGASDCGLQWNLESSSGKPSIGGMGVTVDIPANTVSKVVVQTLSKSRDYVEVGGLFPSLTSAYPIIVGRFWDDKNVSHLTGLNTGSTGGVINGVATTATTPGVTCSTPPGTYPPGGTGSYQAETCTNWCSAADTLVYGISGRSATSADQLSSVTFGTNGPSPVAMTKLVHYPNLDGSTPNASGKAYSEIWYAYNREYTSAGAGTGAGLTSYTSAVKATAGATPVLAANLSNNDTSMEVVSLADPNSRICQGDVLSGDPNINGAVITGPSGCNTTGVYTFSPKVTGNVNKSNVVVSSTTLRVLGSTGANLVTGTANVSTGGTISIAAPAGTNYTLGTATRLGTAFVTQGSSSSTIRVPPGSTLPLVGTQLAIYGLSSSPNGSGAFAPGTKVQSVGTDSFTLADSNGNAVLPSAPLYGASVCGGICAFFNSPSNPAAITQFSVAKSGGTAQFSSGFVCLSGVDQPKIVPVLSTTLTTGRWQEVVH